MILPQIIHEEPCRGAVELKGKQEEHHPRIKEWTTAGATGGREEEGVGRNSSDKCVWSRKEIPYYPKCVCVLIFREPFVLLHLKKAQREC